MDRCLNWEGKDWCLKRESKDRCLNWEGKDWCLNWEDRWVG